VDRNRAATNTPTALPRMINARRFIGPPLQEEDTRLAVLSTRRIELLHLTRPRWPLPLTHRHATGDGQAEPVILGQMRRTVVAELPRARERARAFVPRQFS